MIEEVAIQEQEPQQPDPPKKKLWRKLNSGNLYTKSYEDFEQQFNTPERIGKLYQSLSEKKLYTKTPQEFNQQFFQDAATPKKKVGTIGFEESSLQAGNVLSQSGGVDGEEIPTIEMYTTPSGEMVEANPISLSKKYRELSNRKKVGDTIIGSGLTMGTTGTPVPDEEAQKSAKKLKEDFPNIDFEGISEEIKDIPDEVLQRVGKELMADREQNNPLYQRKLANIKWRKGLEDNLLEQVDKGNIDPDNYNRIKESIDNLPVFTGTGDFTNQRGAIKSLAQDIQLYGGENKDKILENFAIEVSKVYGSAYKNNFDKYAADTPESKYLNNDAQLGLQYLEDVAPEKAKQYERLKVDPKNLEGDALKGYNHLMQTIEETGIGLQQNAVTEELNDLKNKANNRQLTDEEIQKATDLEKKQEELTQKRNELDVKYPDRIEDKVDDAMQEILGQKIGGLNYFGGTAFRSIKNTGQGIWEAVSTPFMSDASNTLRELSIMGEGLEQNRIYHKTEKNTALLTDTMVMQPELQKQVDAITNNKVMTESEKEMKLYRLLKDNTDKFGRVPIKGGKFNINPSSIMYGLSDLGTTLLPFIALETVTGGGATAGLARKFVSTFTAAAATTFHAEYEAALLSGRTQSEAYKEAMGMTAISSLAMAGAATPQKIKALVNPKTSSGKLILSMSDDAIQKVLNKGTPKAFSVIKQTIKDRAKATPAMLGQGAKAGAEFEVAMTAANELKHQIYDTEIDREANFKNSLLMIGNFSGLGLLGHIKYKSPTEMQKGAGLLFGEKPDSYISVAEQMKKDGLLNEQQFEQRKDLITQFGEAYKTLPKNLTEKAKADYLYQTVIKNEANKGKSDLPPKQAAEAEKTALVADHARGLILEPPTEKQLNDRIGVLERKLEPKKDADGKAIEIPEKEKLDYEAELEALKNESETRKSFEKVEMAKRDIQPKAEDVPPPTEQSGKDVVVDEGVVDKPKDFISDMEGKGFKLVNGEYQRNGVGLSIKRGATVLVNKSGDVIYADSPKETDIVLKEIKIIDEAARGKGEATKALNDFLESADQQGYTIYIEPTPIKRLENKNNLTKDQLIKWYEKNGFEKSNNDIWIRKPKEIKNEEAKVTQDTNPPTVKGKEQPLVTDIAPKTESGKEGKEPPPAEPTDTVGEGKGKFEEKARKVAEKIMGANIVPDWLKIDDPNASTKGASAEQVKKALADATIKMGKLLDKGVEFGEAVKEAVKDLVDLMGEGMRGKIEEGFAKDYKNETNYELSGIRKKLVSEKVIEGVDLEKVSDKDMMALGRKILDTGEVKPEALVTKIIEDGKGVLTPTEVVGLITYKRDIDTALQDTYKQLAERKANGEDIGTLGVEAKNLERQINDFDVMAVITAQQQSMAFRLRQRMLDREYNVVTQIEKYKANNNGEIPADIEAKFRDLDKQIKEVKVKLAEAEKKLAEKEGQEAVDNIKESVDREKKYTEELQAELKKERATNRAAKKSTVHKAIDEIMDKWAKKITPEHLRGKNTKGVDADKVFKSVGAVMKKAYDAGEAVTKIVEDAVNYISEKLGNKDWGIEEFKKENWEEKLKASAEKKAKDKPTINEDGTVSIPNEMLRDLVKRGITDINDLTKAVHEQVKKDLPDITERQVRDYITDYGKQVNPTADKLQQQVNTAKRVGRLLSELEDIQNKIKKQKGNNGNKLTDKERELKRQINALSKDVFGKEEKSPEQRLSDAKERVKQRISDLEARIKKKDFAKPEKKLPVTDAELVELNTKKEKLQEEFDKEQYALEIKNRGFWKKWEDRAYELTSGVMRGLTLGVDLSAMGVQGMRRLFTNPKASGIAFWEGLKHLVSEKGANDFLNKQKSQPYYPLLRATKLAIDDKTGKQSVKEGMFVSEWINYIWNKGVAPIAGLGTKWGTNFVRKINPYAASQRAYDGYVNSIRIQAFLKLSKELARDGYTYEADPKVFDKLADFVNTTTGRGSLGAADANSRWLNVFLTAPRKVISEVKLYTPYAFVYYARMPKPVRMKALKDFAQFAGTFMTVNALMWAARKDWGNEEEDEKDNFWNMNSSDFLTHKIGDKRVSIGGGMKSILTMQSRFWSGNFTDQYGNTSKLGDRYGKPINTRLDLVTRFGIGKAAPVFNVLAKKLDERAGRPVENEEIIKNISVPLWMQDIGELYKNDPNSVAPLLTAFSILGANVRKVDEQKPSKMIDKYTKINGEALTDKDLKDFEDAKQELIEKNIETLKEKGIGDTPYKDLTPEEIKEEETYIKGRADDEVKAQMFMEKIPEEKEIEKAVKKDISRGTNYDFTLPKKQQ